MIMTAKTERIQRSRITVITTAKAEIKQSKVVKLKFISSHKMSGRNLQRIYQIRIDHSPKAFDHDLNKRIF